jgi:Leucine-rich repeat (LRR) protein
LLELAEGNAPLRLAEEARRFLQVVREKAAFEGLYLNAVGGSDTDRVVLDALVNLPGWTDEIRIYIQTTGTTGGGLATWGKQDATHYLRMKVLPDGYRVADKDNVQIHTLMGRTRMNYFQALWSGLSKEQKVALDVDTADGGPELRIKITEMALQRRKSAPLRWHDGSRVAYSSPMRLAGRLQVASQQGAPVRAPGSSKYSDALRQRASELYPAHSPAQIERLLMGMGSDERLVFNKLRSLKIQWNSLLDTLQAWIRRETWSQAAEGPRIPVAREAKRRAIRQIIRSWRRQTPEVLTTDGTLHELTFDEVVVGDLPVLPGDFSHIGVLNMNRMGVGAGAHPFLRSFTSLRRLSMVGNLLERLPDNALNAMPKLEVLNLSENRIHLTTQSLSMIEGLVNLKRLSLNFNPTLSRAPNVSRLLLLERLGLRDTGITEWPAGAWLLPELVALDLQDNRIVQIPEQVFLAADRLNQGTNAGGNPLSQQAREQVRRYQQASKISLGQMASAYELEVVRLNVEMSMSSIWLSGDSGAQLLRRQALWRQLYVCPGSKPLFDVLIGLRETVDYRLMYSSIHPLVWEVIEAATQSTTLRQSLFRIADAGASGIDDGSMLFNDLLVRVRCYRALNTPAAYGTLPEQSLVRLLRGSFRLHQVEQIALAHVISRRLEESITGDQAVQVSLALRVGLSERLALPGQSTEAVLGLDVVIPENRLDLAYQEVTRVENSTVLIEWFKAHPLWKEYLESTYHNRFADVELRTRLSYFQLDEQTQLTRQQHSEHMRAIVQNHDNARRDLLSGLTQEILARNPGIQT